MINRTVLKCPKCGECGNIEDSTMVGFKVCCYCGYCDGEALFTPMAVQHSEAPNRYVLQVPTCADVALYRQFGIAQERADLLLSKLVKYVQAILKDNNLHVISVALLLKEGAAWCISPEELVCMAMLCSRYLSKLGAVDVTIGAPN